MGELLLQPEEIARRRTERAYRLAVLELPLLRVVGFAFLSLGLYLNNRYLLSEGSPGVWARASTLVPAAAPGAPVAALAPVAPVALAPSAAAEPLPPPRHSRARGNPITIRSCSPNWGKA